VAIIFLYYYFNDFLYIYNKKIKIKNLGGSATPKAIFWGGRTTPMALGGGQNHPHLAWWPRATPIRPGGGQTTSTNLFIFFKKKIL
jgi:hypothetical protein